MRVKKMNHLYVLAELWLAFLRGSNLSTLKKKSADLGLKRFKF